MGGEMIIKSGLAKAIIQEVKIGFENLSKRIPGADINLETPAKKIDFYKIIR